MKKTKKIIISIIIFILFVFLFLLYGPIPTFREYLITSSITTMNHQYIAHIFYSNKTGSVKVKSINFYDLGILED